MRKRWILFVLTALLTLSGCARQNEESAAPDVVVPGTAAEQEQTNLPEMVPETEEMVVQGTPDEEPVPEEEPAELPKEEAPAPQEPMRDPNDRRAEQSLCCIYYSPPLKYQKRHYEFLTYVKKEQNVRIGELLGTDETYGDFYAVEGYDPRLLLYVNLSDKEIAGELLISQCGRTGEPSPWEELSLLENYSGVTVKMVGEKTERQLPPDDYPQLEQLLAALQQQPLKSFGYLCNYWNVSYPQEFDAGTVTLTLKDGISIPLIVSDREFVRMGKSFCVQLPEETHAALLELAGKGKNK